jgi:16S rRNA (cytosine1402-N4)-methyltransferase
MSEAVDPEGQGHPHKRRVRYRGTHPRAFREKYKEHDPERYAADARKVMERGQTLAGSHRPIAVKEILKVLDPRSGQMGLDATLGYGGHAQELLARIQPGGILHATDVDPLELPRTERRLRELGYGPESLRVHRMNFAGIDRVREEAGRGFDFVLADLGVSSMQIDNPERGFTYKAQGPLDLRLNPEHGQSAADFLKTVSRDQLVLLLYDYSDEPHAEEIALAITERQGSLATTLDLVEAVRSALPGLPKATRDEELKDALARTFQALRIAVNDEFGVLDRFLAALPACLAPGGKCAILSFHSGEDRRVKKSFKAWARDGVYAEVAPDPIRPSPEERRSNPRSAGAKLRWARMPS